MEKAIKNKVAKAVVPAIDVMFQALRFGISKRSSTLLLATNKAKGLNLIFFATLHKQSQSTKIQL